MAEQSFTFTFNSIPTSVEELKALPEASMKDPYAVAALTVLTFMAYAKNPDAVFDMLDYLNGPSDVAAYDKNFIKDRFRSGNYVPYSYCAGATPANNYTPTEPYTITVKNNSYSDQEEGYKRLYVHSSGADSDRYIVLRLKPSTEQWFLNSYGGILVSIRKPAAEDPWA